jgi:hypothetical protein
MARWWWLAPWCVGCVPEAEVDQLRVAVRVLDADTPEVSWERLSLGVRAARLRPCPTRNDHLDWPALPGRVATIPRTGTPQPWTVGFQGPYDTLAASRWRLPRGPWCALDLVMDEGLRGEGELADGRALSLSLTLPSLGLATPTTLGARVALVKGDIGATALLPVVVELGGPAWLAALPAGGSDVTVDDTSPAHDELVAALLAGAALYEDRDDAGQLSDVERARGALTSLVPLVTSEDTDAP